jgi:plasmid stabilization system protein ParE
MIYAVEFTQGAEDDLVRLYDFLLDRAETLEELDVADEAVKVIRQAALSHLSTTPYSYRKVGARSTLRELIIPFGTTGYILRFVVGWRLRVVRTARWDRTLAARCRA